MLRSVQVIEKLGDSSQYQLCEQALKRQMPPFPEKSLSNSDVEAVIAYLKNLYVNL